MTLSFFVCSTLLHTILAWSDVCAATPYQLVDDEVTIHNWFESFNTHLKHNQIDTLPIDQTVTNPNINHIPKQVINAIFSLVNPTAIKNPKLVSISENTLFETLNITFPPNINLKHQIYNILIQIISGNMSIINQYIPNIIPYAHCYCGHQFGYFAGQLGDGRAISLGEYHTDNGNIWELQLKGSGKTPFSRKGDGRAVLRSSIREYLMSEYMHYIGIPTSRAAMLITSETDTVMRDIFSNGNNISEQVAIVLRMAPNWIRFGSFELHIGKNNRYGPNFWESIVDQKYLMKSLLDYIIRYHYKDIYNKYINNKKINIYEIWWIKLLERCMKLVMKWMSIGFVHGCLNTDNMHLLGIGIDYGPFGMMEYFDWDYVPNYSDDDGRYAYDQQVKIFKWNIITLANVLHKIDILSINISSKYYGKYLDNLYEKYYIAEMKKKFGLIYNNNKNKLKLLIDVFFGGMSDSVCDMTNLFRHLNMISIYGIKQCELENENGICIYDENKIKQYENIEDKLFAEYVVKQCVTPSHYYTLQKRKYMIKTHNSEMKNNNSLFEHMDKMDKIRYDTKIWMSFVGLYRNYINKEWKLYKESMGNDVFINKSISEHIKELNDKRIEIMNGVNPKYILRNHMIQYAIEIASNGDYSEIEKLKLMIMNPFSESDIFNEIYDKPISEQTCDSFGNCDLLSCSS